jgi:hypothetical protein
LHYASSPDILRLLLDAGGDVNLANNVIICIYC